MMSDADEYFMILIKIRFKIIRILIYMIDIYCKYNYLNQKKIKFD